MKKISILFAAAAMALAFASCSNLNSTPEFTDDMSFVAFDNLSMSVAEDGKTVKIPITMASIDPAAVSVAYSVVDSEGNLAKEGRNFKFRDNSGVIVFDGKERSSYIEVEIIDNPGVFTGDIKFQIELVSAGELNIGFNKTCTVTITDNDHPLSDILGWFAATAGDGKAWDMELRKDPNDISVVWFYNIGAMSANWAGDDIMYYGNVEYDSATGTGTITCPLGQESEYKYGGTTPVMLYMLDAEAESYFTEGNLVFEISDHGKKLSIPENGVYLLIPGAGYVGMAVAPIVATKK